MTLAEASANFLDSVRQSELQAQSLTRTSARDKALALLRGCFAPNIDLNEITPADLREFLTRQYVDAAWASKPVDQPVLYDLLNTLTDFFTWAAAEPRSGELAGCLSTLGEMGRSLPRAFEITRALLSWLRERGGAFSFPEYLTSFEEGGRSQYDIDVPDQFGAIDGYFRIVRVQGFQVEAEDTVSGRQVWPIVFPAHIAALLEEEYIINLEVVRTPRDWQITGGGLAYPPGTNI